MVSAPPPMFDKATAKPINLEAIRIADDYDEKQYETWMRYQQSKLANVLLAKQFGAVYGKTMKSICVHPGLVQTNLMQHGNQIILALFGAFLWLSGRTIQTPEEGARTQTLLAVMPEDEVVQGAYYGDCVREEEAVVVKNMEDAKALFDYCDEVTKEFQ